MNQDFLKSAYDHDKFKDFLVTFLPDYQQDIRPLNIDNSKHITSARKLGESAELELVIYEVDHDSHSDKRVGLAVDGFRLMKDTGAYNALIVFRSTTVSNWRLSLMTTSQELKNGKVVNSFSNPRRYSYILGENTKTATPFKYLIEKKTVKDYSDLLSRFSVEVVNNEFYKEIAKLYDQLVGTENIKPKLQYPSTGDKTNEFAVRLIGRIIFCWFLREKKSSQGISLIPGEVLSRNASEESGYYHNVLSPLFFEVLNKPIEKRSNKFRNGVYATIPYLNGGLFSNDDIDLYRFDKELEVSVPGLVNVPDEWLQQFIELLERYNFTVDENTSYDTDLSIDPEMLGRVFENLLARINPETGKTVRKSTGSYYTPREIVDYIVDTSLSDYLSTHTNVDQVKINALISYNLADDFNNELTDTESEKVLEALSTLTVLDPACGSGAFPIGMLQKIVFVISILDPNAKWWLSRQLENASPEVKREFENKGVDYIRKLGIIRQTIFGVDIQPIATEIARLRCFLTLIVDEAIDDNAWNRGIRPLPNLDFKFVTANSLMSLPKSELKNGVLVEHQGNLFEETSHIDDLRELRNEYFTSNNHERLELQAKFSDLQRRMFIKNVDEFGGQASGLYTALSRWEPFSNNQSGWFDPDWMFGVKDGFDIVIGNPPYGASLTKEEKTHYQKSYVTAKTIKGLQKGSLDTYTLFIELAHRLVRLNGNVTYIVPMSITSSDSVEGVHRLLNSSCELVKVASFSNRPTQVFQNAGLRVSILFFKKTNTECKSLLTTKLMRKRASDSIQDVLDLMTFANSTALQLKGRYPKIGTEIELNILQKLFNQKDTLKDLQQNNGDPVYYRAAGGRYFNVVTNYPTDSTQEKAIYFKQGVGNSIGLILSSTLFWFYQQAYTDGLHLKSYEIESFRVPQIADSNLEIIDDLYSKYLEDIERKAITHQTSEKNSYKVSSFKEYKLQRSIELIGKIDDLVCALYDLDENETAYIKNYELQYRLNDKEDA